MENIIKKMI